MRSHVCLEQITGFWFDLFVLFRKVGEGAWDVGFSGYKDTEDEGSHEERS